MIDKLTINTFFHGVDALRKSTAILISEGLGRYQIDLPENDILLFEYPNIALMPKQPHLLLFEGLTIGGAMSDHVAIIPITKWTRDKTKPLSVIREIAANTGVVARRQFGDLSLDNEEQDFRRTEDSQTIQKILLRLIAIPRSDAKFLFVTFHNRSLKPIFKIVRSSQEELIIENATK